MSNWKPIGSRQGAPGLKSVESTKDFVLILHYEDGTRFLDFSKEVDTWKGEMARLKDPKVFTTVDKHQLSWLGGAVMMDPDELYDEAEPTSFKEKKT